MRENGTKEKEIERKNTIHNATQPAHIPEGGRVRRERPKSEPERTKREKKKKRKKKKKKPPQTISWGLSGRPWKFFQRRKPQKLK